MKDLLSTKEEVLAQARKFELKGRSRIETYEQLLKAMKDQGLEGERRILMSVNRRVKNLHKRTQTKIYNLPKPKNLLIRSSWTYEVDLELFDGIDDHVRFVSSQLDCEYYYWHAVVSNQLANVLEPFFRKKKEIEQEFFTLNALLKKNSYRPNLLATLIVMLCMNDLYLNI